MVPVGGAQVGSVRVAVVFVLSSHPYRRCVCIVAACVSVGVMIFLDSGVAVVVLYLGRSGIPGVSSASSGVDVTTTAPLAK